MKRKEREQTKMGKEISAHLINIESRRISSRMNSVTRLGEREEDKRNTLVVKIKRDVVY